MKNANRILVSPACGVLLFVMACGGGGSHSNTLATAGGNVQAISVNSGPDGNYANSAFTSVTVCVPGISTCQTISGVLVDTGSAGLRLLSSALTIALPQQKASDGDPVVECLPFVNGYTWGPVQTADLRRRVCVARAVKSWPLL
jgi:hypothetical protein